jgi:hypothetical protein
LPFSNKFLAKISNYKQLIEENEQTGDFPEMFKLICSIMDEDYNILREASYFDQDLEGF